MFPITGSYELPILPTGDYFFVAKNDPSLKRTDTVQYQILDQDKAPLLTAECWLADKKLSSIILVTADVYRPVAKLTKLDEDTYTVDIGGPVGKIEKTHGWQFRDIAESIKLGIVFVEQKPPNILHDLLSIAISEAPAVEGLARIYRFWNHGSDEYFASYYADLNNLEIKTADSALTPYLCIFLVLLTNLTAANQI